MTANVYLTFDGNCREAFEFYREVLGGDFSHISTFGEMPPQEGQPEMPEEMKQRIMHVSLPISEETVIMGSDTGGEWGANFKQGSNFSIAIGDDDPEKGRAIFDAISAGGQITMDYDKTFWGSWFGQCVDKFGIAWMVDCADPEAQKAAMEGMNQQ